MMFDSYSARALHVMLVTRVKAGERGAKMLDVDDLLAAFIIEDQGMLLDAVAGVLGRRDKSGSVLLQHNTATVRPVELHRPFLAADVASRLLQKIQDSHTQSRSVPTATDMPISSDLEHTLNGAHHLMERFKQTKVEPLHLLASALAEESNPGAQMFQEAGITEATALGAIRGDEAS